jgi:uncharacterized protein
MKKIKVFLIHGFEGTPNGGWRPWLMSELQKKDIFCQSLAMPNPAKPLLSEWVNEIEVNVKKYPKDNIYLVGHSLGVPAILHFLQSQNFKNIKGAVLVSGPYKNNKIVLKNFFQVDFDFGKINKTCKKFSIIHGDNDRSVPFEHSIYLKNNLNASLVEVKNGGHLNGSAGFFVLPEAMKELVQMFKKIV